MVDLHKGFEGFESLGPRKRRAEGEGISFSEGMGASPMGKRSSDMAKAEAFYANMLSFVRDILDKASAGAEASIRVEDVLGWADEFCDQFRDHFAGEDLVRLTFQHDDHETNYIYAHSVNVCLLCVKIALDMGLSREKLRTIVIAALSHDIGMMRIPEEIWNRDGRLSSAEYARVQEHPVLGAEILRGIKGLGEDVPLIVLQHQEKADGSGYPRGLKKDEIRFEARLLSLMDQYEAQTHMRKWRAKFLPDKAVQRILDNERGKFDPHFMKMLLKSISIFPVGTWVKISTGEVGCVQQTNETTPMRPLIELKYDRSGKCLQDPRMLDLSKQLLIHAEHSVDPDTLSG